MDAGSLISELKRRRVFRVLVGYGIVSFAVLQIIEPVMHALHLPDVTLTYVVLALAVGFPVAVVLAWAFDVNEGRIERTPPAASPNLTGARVRLLLVGIGVLAAAPGVAWYFLHAARSTTTDAPASGTGAEENVSIAVLPFTDMSEKHDQEYFADGVAEEILNALSHVRELKVIGRTSSFSFKGKSDDLRAIGRKLDVAHVLEGSLRKEGNHVRFAVELIRVADGSHLWSETYDRKLTGILKLQDEIAAAVVAVLKVKLLRPHQDQPSSDVRTTNIEAYEQYLLGTQLQAVWSLDSVRRSIAAFEKAVALDPHIAAASARLAMSLWWSAGTGTPPEVQAKISRAIAAAERAVALESSASEGYSARARVRNDFQWDFAGADADDARALALAPNHPLTLLVHCPLLAHRGRFKESAAACLRAIDLDPLAVGARNLLTYTYLASGDFAQARAVNTRVLELSPDSVAARDVRCKLDFFEGNRAAAHEHCFFHGRPSRFWKALMAAEWNTPAEGARTLTALIAQDGEAEPCLVAEVYAWRGDADRAVEWLERAWQQHACLESVKLDPFLRKVHGDPRYTALLEKMNLPVD